MAVQPPQPPDGSGSGGEDWLGGRDGGSVPADAGRWWRWSVAAWYRMRALPGWAQAVLWLLAWPVAAAVYVASTRRLGRLAPPLTAVVLLGGGLLWWGEPFLAERDDHRRDALAATGAGWDAGLTGKTLAALPVTGEEVETPSLADLDPSTVVVEIVECVQTRSTSLVRDRTVRQPRVTLHVTNLGPKRTVVLHAGVLLEGYDWNGGWKPTASFSAELGHRQTVETTLMPDYRHQTSYTPEGLQACGLLDLELLSPRTWPEHPVRRAFPLEQSIVAAPEREFDAKHDLRRSDAR